MGVRADALRRGIPSDPPCDSASIFADWRRWSNPAGALGLPGSGERSLVHRLPTAALPNRLLFLRPTRGVSDGVSDI